MPEHTITIGVLVVGFLACWGLWRWVFAPGAWAAMMDLDRRDPEQEDQVLPPSEYVIARWQEIHHEVNYERGFAVVVHASDDTGNYERVLRGDEVEAWLGEVYAVMANRTEGGEA